MLNIFPTVIYLGIDEILLPAERERARAQNYASVNDFQLWQKCQSL